MPEHLREHLKRAREGAPGRADGAARGSGLAGGGVGGAGGGGGDELVEMERRLFRWWHPLLGLALGGLLLWSGWLDDVPREVQKQVVNWQGTIEGVGPVLGPVLFIGTFVVLTMLWFPASLLTALSGAMFGSVVGVISTTIGSMIAAVLSFLVARHVARDRVGRWLRDSDRFQKLDRMTAKHGGLMVFVVRAMNFFPFAMVNYGFGLTRVGLGTYTLWTFVGRLLGTVVLVVLADVLIRAVVERQVQWSLVAVVLVTAGALGLAVGYLNRRLHNADEALAASDAAEAEGQSGGREAGNERGR